MYSSVIMDRPSETKITEDAEEDDDEEPLGRRKWDLNKNTLVLQRDGYGQNDYQQDYMPLKIIQNTNTLYSPRTLFPQYEGKEYLEEVQQCLRENEVMDDNLRIEGPCLQSLHGSRKLDDVINCHSYKQTRIKIYYLTQIFAAISVSMGSLIIGYCTAYTSPALVTMIHENSTIQVSKDEGSWVVGLMPLAAITGSVMGGCLIDMIGRKKTIISISVPFFISWIIIATASNVYLVYIGRAIGGMWVGVGSLAFPVFLGETMQAEKRGQLGLLPTAFGNIGILVCFVAGKYLDWSELAYLGAALPVPFFFMMLVIPETPHYYVSCGKVDRARESLHWLRDKDADIDGELKDIVNTTQRGKGDSRSSILDMFKREYCYAISISLGLMFFQQLSGINAVIFYTVTIFRDAGSTIDENLSTIIVGIVNFVSTFVASALIERLGRKILLYISSSTMIVTLMTLGTFFYVQSNYDVSDYGWIPLASFVIYVIGFSLGFGPIPWLMMGEILPNKVRGTAASIITVFNWTCTFMVTKTFNNVIDAIGRHGTFWMFGIICMVGLVFTIIFVPETKGKTLEEIELKLSGKKNSSQNECVEKQSLGF